MSGPTVVRKITIGDRQNEKPNKRMPPPREDIPRIAQLLALAIRFEQMLRDGEVESYADLARLTGVSRARISQIMRLVDLSPRVQGRMLFPRATRSGP